MMVESLKGEGYKVALSTKAELVGCLLSHWQLGLFYEFGTSVSQQLTQLISFVLFKY